ncbi:MAG: ABC transporter substrate-binding protein [Chloroflexota bacterium]
MAAKQGAELAIREANRSSKEGKYYVLRVRNMEGPWGTGAKESVSLVFDEDVWAVIGSVDGRNSHLAEQVSAKTRVPFISALSGDPTLGQAFIPWFFSCVPNDNQAAGVITRKIEKGTPSQTIILSSEDYDSKMAATSLQKNWAPGKTKKPEIIYYQNVLREAAGIVKKVSHAGSLVFFGPPSELEIILQSLHKISPTTTVYAPYLPMHEKIPVELKKLEGVIMLNPGVFFNNGKQSFTSAFLNAYGNEPGALQAYAYDAVNVLIIGINLSGNDSTSLFRNIAKVSHHGATGDISFDENGSRKTFPGLIRVEKGRFIQVED